MIESCVGFITYATPEEAKAAQQDMNDQELDGRRIRVDFSDGKGGGKGGKGGGGLTSSHSMHKKFTAMTNI